jgi:NAD(P)-dependent dehydrogenase (short-subunit alcohol dehydrogenase family)
VAHIVLAGGSSRIAKEIIEVLVCYGHQITVLDICQIEKKDNVFFVECDLQNPALFKEIVGKVIEGDFGEIDAIINLARTPRSPGLIKEFTEELLNEWRETFNVQVIASYFLTVEVAKNEKNRNRLKSVVNVSSILSQHVSNAESASYQSSKAALESISRILAAGLGESRVKVNTVALGYIENKVNSTGFSNYKLIEHTLDSIRVLNAKLESADIGKVLNFLISPDSSGISGQTIVVDQGLGIRETLDASIRSAKASQPFEAT